MNQLQNFIRILSGRFNNAQRLHALQAEGVTDFPYAEHVNTPCNDKITGLPSDFPGVFLVEESYYTIGGRTNASPHLFLFTEEADGAVKLTSYDLPDGCSKTDFTYQTMPQTDYAALRPSAKFTPALYRRSNGVWEGGSESMFTPVLKFTLFERFSEDVLEVSECMEMNGRRTFGYDQPILYRRAQ